MLSSDEENGNNSGGGGGGDAAGGSGSGDDFDFFENLGSGNEEVPDDASAHYGAHPFVETIETEVDAPDPTTAASGGDGRGDERARRRQRNRPQERSGSKKRRTSSSKDARDLNEYEEGEAVGGGGGDGDDDGDDDDDGFRNPNPDDGQFYDVERTGKTLHPIRNTTETRDVAYGTNCDGDRKYVVGARTQRMLDARRIDEEDFRRLHRATYAEDGCEICRTLAQSRNVPGSMHENVGRILALELYARGDAHAQIRTSETLRRMVFEYKRDVFDVCRNACAQARVPLYEWTELKLRRHFRECDVAQSRVIAEQLSWFDDMVEMTRKQSAFYERDSMHGTQYHINTEMLKSSLLLAREHRHAAGEYVMSVRREKEARLPTLERQQAHMDRSTSHVRMHSAKHQRKAMQRRQNGTFNPNNI
jgi:hypothetical protein